MYNPLRPTTIERIISAQGSTRQITLSEKIQILRGVIARMEATDFPGKAETLEAKRAMLAEMELALELGSQARARLVRNALALDVAYALQPERRAAFVKQINERGN